MLQSDSVLTLVRPTKTFAELLHFLQVPVRHFASQLLLQAMLQTKLALLALTWLVQMILLPKSKRA
jgi:hypothetical protein